MKKAAFYSIILAILSFIYLPKLLDLFNKFSCESSGKKYLTRTDNKKVCIEEFNDAGKECHFAGECKGHCIWLQPTPIAIKTPASNGYYNPPPNEYKGVCSKYISPGSCYKNTPGSSDSWEYTLDNSGKPSDTIFICPPPQIR